MTTSASDPARPDACPEPTGPLRRPGRRRWFVVICLLGIPLSLVGLDHLADATLSLPARHLLFPSRSKIRHESSEFDVEVLISEQGLRDKQRSPTPPPGGTRMVAIGDSFTFGWGVTAEQAWPSVVERLGGGINETTEVINMGFPGASPNDYTRIIRTAIREFHPEVILVGTLQGDDLIQLVEQEPPEVAWSDRVRAAAFPTLDRWLRPEPSAMESYRSVFLKSQAYLRSTWTDEQKQRYQSLSPGVRQAYESGLLNPSLLHTAIVNPRRFEAPLDEGPRWHTNATARWRRCVNEWAAACRDARIELYVVIVPDGPYVSAAAADGMAAVGYVASSRLRKTTVFQDIVSDTSLEAGAGLINPVAEFREAARGDAVGGDYFELDGHFTPSGHERLGRAVIRAIWPPVE